MSRLVWAPCRNADLPTSFTLGEENVWNSFATPALNLETLDGDDSWP